MSLGAAERDATPPRALVLDVDGVLLDATDSYWAVAERAARLAGAAVGASDAAFSRDAEIPRFKAAGGFNDDWDLARAIGILLCLRAHLQNPPDLPAFLAENGSTGVETLAERWLPRLPEACAGALEARRVTRLCGALYGGLDRCQRLFGFDPREVLPEPPNPGLHARERILVEPALLHAIADAGCPLALLTGRNPPEAEAALARLGVEIPAARQWTWDGVRVRKPDPAGLVFFAQTLGTPLVFIGDTADDAATARAALAGGANVHYAHVGPTLPPAAPLEASCARSVNEHLRRLLSSFVRS